MARRPALRAAARLLLVAAAASLGLGAAAPEAFRWNLPPGVAPPPVPTDNPMTVEKVELGRRLFYDADLSIDGTTACATCHEQHRGFADGDATHPGAGGAPGRRNVMGLANVGYLSPLTWADPRQRSLEHQLLTPMFGDHPVEMGMSPTSTVLHDRLAEDACYPRMFAAAFPEDGGGIEAATVAKAIAAFERSLVSFDSPFDRAHRGDATAMTDDARRGERLFRDERVGCAGCHAGPLFTDRRFHRLDAPSAAAADRGLWEVTGLGRDDQAFRTPSLRNVALTAPYLHDGSAQTLAAAIRAHGPRGQALGETETAALVAFLDSLSDPGFAANPAYRLPPPCPRPDGATAPP